MRYDAFLSDGTAWDSSRKREKPLRFRVGTGQVIPGLDEGVKQLSLGEARAADGAGELGVGRARLRPRAAEHRRDVFELELIELV